MNRSDLMKMLTAMFLVFLTAAFVNNAKNTTRTAFFVEAESVTLYDISYEEGHGLSDEALEPYLKRVIKHPELTFKTVTYDEGELAFDGEFYARILEKDGTLSHARFSDFAYAFQVVGKVGYYRFKLINQEDWLFY